MGPSQTKYRKQFKGRVRTNLTKGGDYLSFGSYGLKSLDGFRATPNQLESARKAMARCMKREGKIWIRIFPDIPVSKKPAEVRMGKGKGSVEYYCFRVSPGRILIELEGITEEIAYNALQLASSKLPGRMKIIKRLDMNTSL
ncbi:MAG: 50S ribosomal protein L16 [Rickettsiales bacterium]